MRNRRSIDLVSLLVTGASLALIAFASLESGPAFDSSLHSEIGRRLAKETMNLLAPGGKVILIARDTESYPQPAMDILVRGFSREMERYTQATIKVREVSQDPLRPVKVPSGDFFELIRRSGKGDVLVSLLGPPLLTLEQLRALPEVRPGVVAFCPGIPVGMVNLDRLLGSGLMQVAIVDRPETPDLEDAMRSEAQGFDQLYTVRRSQVGNPSEAPHAR